MAYIVSRPKGRWEVRESHATERGPRSTTLATFRNLNQDVIDHARKRSSRPLKRDDLVKAAMKVGAPVVISEAEYNARELLWLLSTGKRPKKATSRLLVDALRVAGTDEAKVSDNARSAAHWASATMDKRADTLLDLLLFADSVPCRGKRRPLKYPRIVST